MAEKNWDQDNGTLTHLLHRARSGDITAKNEFCALVYQRLRAIAQRELAGNGNEKQSESLVNELFLQLLERDQIWDSPNRRYFFATAIDQMRKILIDYYRHRKTLKNGGNLRRVKLDDVLNRLVDDPNGTNRWSILDIEEALDEMNQVSPRQHQVILHRFYGGLTSQETADVLEISLGTVERDWRLARNKLLLLLRGKANGSTEFTRTN